MIHPSIPDSTIRQRKFLSWESTIVVDERILFFRAMTRKGAARKAIDAYIWESHPWE